MRISPEYDIRNLFTGSDHAITQRYMIKGIVPETDISDVGFQPYVYELYDGQVFKKRVESSILAELWTHNNSEHTVIKEPNIAGAERALQSSMHEQNHGSRYDVAQYFIDTVTQPILNGVQIVTVAEAEGIPPVSTIEDFLRRTYFQSKPEVQSKITEAQLTHLAKTIFGDKAVEINTIIHTINELLTGNQLNYSQAKIRISELREEINKWIAFIREEEIVSQEVKRIEDQYNLKYPPAEDMTFNGERIRRLD